MKMKYVMVAFCTVLSAAVDARPAKLQSVQTPSVTEVVVNVHGATVVSGGDPSEPRAVVSGMFPNTCYSWNRATVTHVSAYLHEVRVIANLRSGYCLMVLVPFSEEIALGRLTRGDHVIRFMNGDGTFQDKNYSIAP